MSSGQLTAQSSGRVPPPSPINASQLHQVYPSTAQTRAAADHVPPKLPNAVGPAKRAVFAFGPVLPIAARPTAVKTTHQHCAIETMRL